MDDGWKAWTTVGSAGTLDQTDLAKVHLFQSVVQLGTDLGPPRAVREAPLSGQSFGTLAATN